MSLFEDACAVRVNAHAPYSGFKVGAALRTADDQVFTGCNVENVAYPEGTCAEAGAIAAMAAAGCRTISEIWVVADSDLPVTPCGGCRQKLAEFSAPDTLVVMAGLEGEKARMTMAELLPGSFSGAHMSRATPGQG